MENNANSSLTELDLLKIVCTHLENTNISYMLTGSFASNFYARPRMTRDIDIIIQICEDDIERIIDMFQGDFYVDRFLINEALKHQSMFNIIHMKSVFKVDFIIRKDDLYRKEEFHRRKRVLWNDTPIWIVAPEDLIISKLFWAKDSLSELQLNDVKNLYDSIQNLDEKYIEKWVQFLNLEHVFEKVKTHA